MSSNKKYCIGFFFEFNIQNYSFRGEKNLTADANNINNVSNMK